MAEVEYIGLLRHNEEFDLLNDATGMARAAVLWLKGEQASKQVSMQASEQAREHR